MVGVISMTNGNALCKSVFLNGENVTTKEKYTYMWIKIINRLEKSEFFNLTNKK